MSRGSSFIRAKWNHEFIVGAKGYRTDFPSMSGLEYKLGWSFRPCI